MFLHFPAAPDLKAAPSSQVALPAGAAEHKGRHPAPESSPILLCTLPPQSLPCEVHQCDLEMSSQWALLCSHKSTTISCNVLCMLNFSSVFSFGQHLLFPAAVPTQSWYCFTRIWRPCVFVSSMDNVVSVKNHHMTFVLILFPCARGHLGCRLQITYRAVNV